MTKKDDRRVHNTHMLLPQRLWEKATALARAEETNLTRLVCEGLNLVFEKRRREAKK